MHKRLRCEVNCIKVQSHFVTAIKARNEQLIADLCRSIFILRKGTRKFINSYFTHENLAFLLAFFCSLIRTPYTFRISDRRSLNLISGRT